MKIKSMLILQFSILAVIIIATIGILCFITGSKIIEDEEYKGMNTALQGKIDHIGHELEAQQISVRNFASSYLALNLKETGKNDPTILKELQNNIDYYFKALNTVHETGKETSVAFFMGFYDVNGVLILSSDKSKLGEKLPADVLAHERSAGVNYPKYQYDSAMKKGKIIAYEDVVNKDNKFAGVFKIIFNSNVLDEVVLGHSSMGETSEFFLVRKVGDVMVYITPLRWSKTVADVKWGDPERGIGGQHALSGIAGHGIIKNYIGKMNYSVWAMVPNTDIGIVGNVTIDEATKPIIEFRNYLIIIGFIILILVIGYAMFYSKLFSNPFEKLVHAFAKIGKGELNTSIEIRQNGLTDKLICSELFNLSDALTGMTKDLIKFDNANKETIWLRTGISELNDKINGEIPEATIAENVLSHVIPYVQAQAGALYLVSDNDNKLKFMAGYAYKVLNESNMYITLGDGLVGQAAKERKVILLKDIPKNYIKINSGLGEVSPNNILIVPFIGNFILEGVMVIATSTNFTEMHLQFINGITDNIAIAFATTRSRIKINKLLAESQQQAEELAAQSEELRVQQEELMETNVNLEIQAEKLKASDEELRVQQEELMESNQELEEKSQLLEEKNQAVEMKNKELDDARKELERKAELLEMSSKYKSEFLANMSHELRTPLNSILLLSQLLADNYDSNLTGEQIEFANVINNSGNGLLELINQVLDLSKIEAGKMDINYDDLELKAILRSINGIFEPLAKDKQINYACENSLDLRHRMITDRIRLEQVLKNLLSNAFKFTDVNGHVTLKIYTPDENEIRKLNLNTHQVIAFSVTDTGIGIPADKLDLVFEAFKQADGSTHRKYGGTGLGLSISREIAHMLIGEITIVSQLGIGSTFTLYLPVDCQTAVALRQKEMDGTAEQPDERLVTEVVHMIPERNTNKEIPSEDPNIVSFVPAEIPDDRDKILGSDKVILIIEDDINFAQALMKFARDKGYKVVVAVSGENALPFALKYKPVGILLDIQLPVKSGWTILKEFKANSTVTHIPVHLMSSLDVKSKESIEAGAIDFMNKSKAKVELDEVFTRIETMSGEIPKTILLVEDNEMHLGAMRIFLSSVSKNFLSAKSAKEAYEMLEKHKVDCMVLDLGLPDASGYEVLEKIKTQKKFEKLPVIIYTGTSVTMKEEQQIKQFANAIIMKTADSYKRLMNEVKLFLHVIEDPIEDKLLKKPYLKNEVLANKYILLVDDDNRNIFSLTKVLEQHQVRVIPAINGRDAINVLKENPEINLVLMDMMMPEMDGFESIKKIRENSKWSNIPIISVTAKTMMGDREKCIEAGASDYITKPVDVDQLISLLRVWLFK